MNRTSPFRIDERGPSTRSPAIAPPSINSSARRTLTRLFWTCLLVGLALTGCSSAKLVSFQDVSKRPAARPAVVYVADFELAPDSIQSETLTAFLPLHAYLERSKAQSLVATMSTSIVEDLAKKGIAAEPLPANAPLPKQGWLLRGVFRKIDEGNRVQRAVIGFGSGKTDLEVTISVDDLSAGMAPTPLYTAQTDATSNKLPGAVVTLNPYVAAAKFVLAGRDLDRGTDATAEKIADLIVARVMGTPQKDQHDEPTRNAVIRKGGLTGKRLMLLSGMIDR
jgi:hypothetical protein